jgi:hypothetical protein
VQAIIEPRLTQTAADWDQQQQQQQHGRLIAMVYSPGGPNQESVTDVMLLAGSAAASQYVQHRVVKSSTQLYSLPCGCAFRCTITSTTYEWIQSHDRVGVKLTLGLWAEDLVQVHDMSRPSLHRHTSAHVYMLGWIA